MPGRLAGHLAGRVAVVTGAASGIGAAISVALAQEGARVALVDLAEPAAAEPVLAAVRGYDRQAMYVQTDVADEQAVSEMARSVMAHFGRVDVLVNNAGVGAHGTVEQTTPEEWQRVLATNLTGPYLCSRAVLPSMRGNGGGAIIIISSGAGRTGYAGMAAYCASKFGLRGFAEALAAEVGEAGIKVSTIYPGTTVTDFGGGPRPRRPGVKVLFPQDVAEAVLYLLRQSAHAWTQELTLWPFRE